ncbi:MAG: response regulator [Planctomycetaceae bacterium]
MTHRVHICDDEPYILLAVSLKFSKSGFEVTTANDGEAAWVSMQRQPPHLLITDLQMPRLDGLGLIKRMRADPALCDIPVILLTAKGFELDEDELRDEYGVHHLVCKPFSPRQLVALTHSLLGTSAAVSTN